MLFDRIVKKAPRVAEHKIKKVNQYVFNTIDEIGSGYSAVVYRGKNSLNGATVAIKVVDLRKIPNAVQRNLLQNETKALHIISHPNVLKALHIMQTANNFYFVTQLFEQNLEQVLRIKGKFSQQQIIRLFFNMANALCYLQSLGILHRDIKPSNIFLRNHEYILGDFGFCHFLNMPCLQQGFNVGSPLYMSPQSIKSSIYSHKSDIWSLGITAIELLLGYKPFASLTYDELIVYLCQRRFYRSFQISNQLKQILDLIFQYDIQARIGPQELLTKISSYYSHNMTPMPVPSYQIPTNQINNLEVLNRRGVSRNKQKFQSGVKFKIGSSNAILSQLTPKYYQNKENFPNSIQKNNINSNMKICMTQKKIKSRPTQKEIFEQNNRLSSENHKIQSLQNLYNLLVTDQKLGQSFNKLKLLRVLSFLPNIQFHPSLEHLLSKYPSDPYFNYTIHTINLNNFQQISHYLTFLMQIVYNQMQMQHISQNFEDQNYINRLNGIFEAMSLWKAPAEGLLNIIQNNSPQINDQRNKCQSAKILNCQFLLHQYDRQI